MIPNEFIQTLLGRVDIVEVIDRYVPLKKAGANHVACCPFHREKTPSFTVSQAKQFYHCFGCGAHGTAIGFLMEYAGRPFVEAVEDLARNAGLAVPQTARHGEPAGGEGPQGLDALLAAARFYKRQLKASARAIDYLRGRGLTGQIAARFGIGYAPDAWQGLADAVDDYQDPVLEQTGLVIVGEGGRRHDRFRDRIMFPIHDTRGQVIGFGGRVLDKGEPKYLNSPETPYFSKGRELYGLFQARQAIRNSGRVIVVEGYMDVVALAQHGIENVVATLGTATTTVHASKLLRHADAVVFCFDGDEAGRRAAWRALESTIGTIADGKEARFLFLPDGLDPDDFVRAKGADAFVRMADDAVPLSEFLIAELRHRHPGESAESKAALVAEARPYLEQLRAPVLAAILRRQLASLSGLPDAEVVTRRPASRESARSAARESAPRATPSEARTLLKAVLAHPPLAARLAGIRVEEDSREADALAAVLELLADPTVAEQATTAGVLESLRDSPPAETLWTVAAQVAIEQLDESAAIAEVDALLARHAERCEAQRIQALLQRGSLSSLTPDERRQLARFRKHETDHPERATDGKPRSEI